MNEIEIGWGLLLNMIFWIGVISAMVFFGVWVGIRFWTTPRAKASPHPSPAREEDEEQERKAA
jgi:uncharacterized membrane protein